MTKLGFLMSRISKQLWIRPTLLSLAACAWVIGAYGLQFFLPDRWSINIERSTLTNLFAILASSMLTVATFAVSALVATFSNVSSTSTPRARVLVMSDSSAQNALASFIGTFIYSVVALVALSALTYGAVGRFGLFIGFVVSVGFVLMSFLRWVALVSNLGSLDDTIDRAESAATVALSSVSTVGGLGGREYTPGTTLPKGTSALSATIGYICHVDTKSLAALAQHLDADIWLLVRPGSFVHTTTTLAVIAGRDALSSDDLEAIRAAFSISHARDISTDPRFSFIVLSEIAIRALSAAINDPGTAIRVIGVQLRLLTRWADTRAEADRHEPEFPRVRVPTLSVNDLLDDAFMGMIRDGASFLEVSMRVQKSLHSLALLGREDLADASRLRAKFALAHSLEKISLEYHRDRLRECARFFL
jgi:uncharacterized membrane protein